MVEGDSSDKEEGDDDTGSGDQGLSSVSLNHLVLFKELVDSMEEEA
jgi:hypothetical protein